MTEAFGANGSENLGVLERAEAENGSAAPLETWEAALAAATTDRGWLAHRVASRARETGELRRAARHAETALTEPLNPLARSDAHELVADAAAKDGDSARAERHYVLAHLEDNLRTSAWHSLRALLERAGSTEFREMFFPFLGVPEAVLRRACPDLPCLPRKPPPWPVLRFPNARTLSFSPPRGVAPFNYSLVERLRTTTPVDDLLVWELEDARLFYRYGSMHVVHEGALVAPVSTGDLPVAALERPTTRLCGTVGVIADLFYAPNYAHWLLDAVPRVHVLRSAPGPAPEWYLANWSGAPYQTDHLAALGIRPDQLLSATELGCIHADRLRISMASMSVHHPAQGAANWAVNFVRQTMLPDPPPGPPARRLFVSRKDGTTRRIVNEDALFQTLAERFGFERVVLADHDAPAQARLFRDAAVVVAAHGAGNANFVFCARGAKIFEIFSPLHGTSAFFQIAGAVGAEYWAVEGDETLVVPVDVLTRSHANPHGSRDVAIDAERLSRILGEAGVSRR